MKLTKISRELKIISHNLLAVGEFRMSCVYHHSFQGNVHTGQIKKCKLRKAFLYT